MTDDAGIDRQKLLDEIVGGSAPSEPGSAPPPDPPRVFEPPAPAALPPPGEAAAAPGAGPRPAASAWTHRRELAAILLVFAGVVWLGVGVAVVRLVPFVLGAAFLGLGLALQARENRS